MNKKELFVNFLDRLSPSDPVLIESLKAKFESDYLGWDDHLARSVDEYYGNDDDYDPEEAAEEDHGSVIGYISYEDEAVNVYEDGYFGKPKYVEPDYKNDPPSYSGLQSGNLIDVDGHKYMDGFPLFDDPDAAKKFNDDEWEDFQERDDLMIKLDVATFDEIMKKITSNGTPLFLSNKVENYINDLRYIRPAAIDIVFPKYEKELDTLFKSERNLLMYLYIFPRYAQDLIVKKYLPELTRYFTKMKPSLDKLKSMESYEISDTAKGAILSSLGE